MSIELALSARHHHLGEYATQPIAPRYGTLSALLLLVGKSPLGEAPCHRTVPQPTQPRPTAESRLNQVPSVG
jgi:hypothetical protein